MSDIAAQAGDVAPVEKLAAALAVAVVDVNPRTGAGVAELARVVTDALAAPSYVCGFEAPATDSTPTIPVLAGPGCRCTGATSCCSGPAHPAPPVPREGAAPRTEELAEAEALFTWVEGVMAEFGMSEEAGSATVSDKIDRFLLHPLIGIPVFLGLMWVLFQLTTAVAEPIMDWAESLVTGPVMRAIVGDGKSRKEPLLLVLPPYQVPRLAVIGASTGRRVWSFVSGAGTAIVATLAVVWVLQAIPMSSEHRVAEVPVTESLYGTVAEGISPVFAPAGYGSWQAASALMTGFVAKEVVVGNMAQSFAVEEPEDPHDAGTLGEKIRANFDESSGGHGKAAALAFLIFVLSYTPCLATVAEQKRMLGFKIAGGTLVVQLAIAWALSVGVFNVAKVWW
ncbi:hypothetical protein BSZ39_05460 [Bowdeniella nasicola]|uniref:Nucleoside transporter/FeoB GTPase Gate domain-containing protein n=1 Tax=Bowdeniella nasicola TaxID=208480 RepID=A0A1Q5Q2Y5_9ACTO|nr:nucleoside recognition domain-containing protein [Bowdeniella nasicola]OKL54167.1 hypothetical protein BSZ39_05460 [Bowdeniella nasicola]